MLRTIWLQSLELKSFKILQTSSGFQDFQPLSALGLPHTSPLTCAMEPPSPQPQNPQEECQNALLHHLRGSYATREQLGTLQATITAQQADLHTVGQQVATLTASASQQVTQLTLVSQQVENQTVRVGQQMAALSQQMALLTAHLGSSPSLEGPTTTVFQTPFEQPSPELTSHVEHGRSWAPLHTDPQLPTFEGTGDYAEWFEQCEEIFDAKRIHPSSQLKFARLALRGMAHTLVREKQPQTLLALQAILSGRFRLPNEDFHLTTKLRSLVQHEDNLEVYLQEFKFVAAKLPKLSDDDKRITFMNGLSPQVNFEVLRARPLTFEEAERAALDFYACRRYTKVHEPFESNVVHAVKAMYGCYPGDPSGAGHNSAGSSVNSRSPRSESPSSRRSTSPRQDYRGSDEFRQEEPRSTDPAEPQYSRPEGRYCDYDRGRRPSPSFTRGTDPQLNRGACFQFDRGKARGRGRSRGRAASSRPTSMELEAMPTHSQGGSASSRYERAHSPDRPEAANDRR